MHRLDEDGGSLHLGLLFVAVGIIVLIWFGVRTWQSSSLVKQLTWLVREGRKTVAESKECWKGAPVFGNSTTVRPEGYYTDVAGHPALFPEPGLQDKDR